MFSSSINRSSEFAGVTSAGRSRSAMVLIPCRVQIVADILDGARGLIASGFENFDDHDGVGLLQERQCVENGTAGFARVLPGDGNVPGRERRNALRHHQDGPACLQEKTAGIQRAKGILILPLVSDDDEIGGAGFAREQLGRKIQSGSPFRPAIELVDRGVKLLPFPAQEGFHVLKMKILRRPVVPRLFRQEDRHRRPACDADQVSAKSLGKVGGYGDTAP